MNSLICLLLIAGISLIWVMALFSSDRDMRASAVEQRCAYYAPDSGKFTWGAPPVYPSEGR